MTRKEQHKQRKRKEKGRYIHWSSGLFISLSYMSKDLKRHSAFYISKVEED